ncbi:MAG: hypothetical protein RDU20_15775 [Desulfomonilaceae bacterium]|nr:hypothetical protein [Desulfomonilaceae bacterium]
MASRLGAEYPVEIEAVSKPRAEYQSMEYADLDLPVAPAIMLDDEVLVEGSDVREEVLVGAIRTHLGMPPLESEKKGILGRLFDK